MIQNPLIEKRHSVWKTVYSNRKSWQRRRSKFFYLFKSITLSSIDALRSIKIKKPDLDSIYDFTSKTEPSKVGKDTLGQFNLKTNTSKYRNNSVNSESLFQNIWNIALETQKANEQLSKEQSFVHFR